MAKEKQGATTQSGLVVTLYGRGMTPPQMQFDPVHAERLLKMENTQWSDKPFDVGEKAETGVADNSTNQNPV